MLERVQNKFLKYASYVLEIECPPHNYLPVLEYLKLDSLANRRRHANLAFLSKLLNGQIDSPHRLSLIPLNVPPRFTRQHTSFNLPTISINYGLNEPLRRTVCLLPIQTPSFLFHNLTKYLCISIFHCYHIIIIVILVLYEIGLTPLLYAK